eukprot:2266430-Pyramimonas_sp.AAC.1
MSRCNPRARPPRARWIVAEQVLEDRRVKWKSHAGPFRWMRSAVQFVLKFHRLEAAGLQA